MSRARALAQYEIADGKPELINTELDAMLAVTPEQIQAAAKKYFTTDKRVILEIQPAPQGGPRHRPRPRRKSKMWMRSIAILTLGARRVIGPDDGPDQAAADAADPRL